MAISIVYKMPTERSTGSYAATFRVSWSEYLDQFATTVTIRTVTETRDSMNRVTGTSTTTTTAKADIQWVSKKDLMHLNVGDVKVGDGQIFFKHNQTINLHDELEFNGKRWRIVEQIEGEVVGGDVVYTGYIIRKNVQS